MRLIIRVVDGSRPVVIDIITIVHEPHQALAIARAVLGQLRAVFLLPVATHHERLNRWLRVQSVPRRPLRHPVLDVRQTAAVAEAALDVNRHVVAAVEREERDILARGLAGNGLGCRVATAVGVRDVSAGVVGAGDGGEGGDAGGGPFIARQTPDHAAALRLARRVDAGRVYAQLGLQVVQDR